MGTEEGYYWVKASAVQDAKVSETTTTTTTAATTQPTTAATTTTVPSTGEVPLATAKSANHQKAVSFSGATGLKDKFVNVALSQEGYYSGTPLPSKGAIRFPRKGTSLRACIQPQDMV